MKYLYLLKYYFQLLAVILTNYEVPYTYNVFDEYFDKVYLEYKLPLKVVKQIKRQYFLDNNYPIKFHYLKNAYYVDDLYKRYFLDLSSEQVIKLAKSYGYQLDIKKSS